MLAKKYRLPIGTVTQKRAKTIRGRYFSVKFFESSLPYRRFGVIVSKKIAKQAVRRNAIKRLVFLIAKNHLNGFGDYLFIAQQPMDLKKEKSGIIEELQKIMRS